MQIYIHVKQLGKRRNVIDKKAMQLDKVPGNTASLIAGIVALQVQEYNQRLEQSELLKYLTDEEIQAKATAGKISFDINYNGMAADTEKAVRNALQSFEDGIFRIFADGKELESLQEPVSLQEGSELTFVRLTMLAGRMW
ncbi:hypothetical protein [Parabacteroides hominis]|uniref:Uncharacterized protein n=1 Tax=Parabacteroides hominis TaxID=2763057 RepID=A0ABR7DNP6_9BACT|nr:hypothetical protein [Parabacteroides hominis]MBC5633036.1 hypothetical protein [Parabacteroides hominis]